MQSVTDNLPSKEQLESKLEKSNVSSIAKEYGTYPNKIRRLAASYGLTVPNHSETQSRILQQGLVQHPTKGKVRPESTKIKISEKVFDSWTTERKEDQAEVAKKTWDNMTDQQHADRTKKAFEGIKNASKRGSKLEHYLFEKLIKAGHIVDFHTARLLGNEKLHIDMLITSNKIAIEVDGPSHFEPIWGDKNFKRNQKADVQKTGLLIQAGFMVIRVEHRGETSQKFYRDIGEKLLATVDDMKNGKTEKVVKIKWEN